MSVDVNELVKSIAAEVLKQLQSEDRRECVLVLAERECSVADKVRQCVGDAYEYFFFGEETSCTEFSRYIVPSLCVCEMSDLAVGKAYGRVMTEVLRLMLMGKTVEVLEFGYQAYAQTAPGPLYALYEAHEKTLAGFGLKKFQPKAPDTVRFRETLVTEAVVNDVAGQGASTLLVLPSALVTPQAVEAAKNLNIYISKTL